MKISVSFFEGENMKEVIEIENLRIEDMIYEVRGVEVMFASDVAKLYQVETKVLNQTIKRNINGNEQVFHSRFFILIKNTWNRKGNVL